MSKEFFDTMEKIIKTSNRIKFWEGTHPEIEARHHLSIEKILNDLMKVENRVIADLKKKAKLVAKQKPKVR